MKIRKFKAANSHLGMQMIRDALGDDASILACYEVADGVEFIVTSDDLSAIVNSKGQPVQADAKRAKAIASATTSEDQVQRRQSNLRDLGLTADAKDSGVSSSISSIGASANILMRNTRAATAALVKQATNAVADKPAAAPKPAAPVSAHAAASAQTTKPAAAAKPENKPTQAEINNKQAQADILALKQELGSIRHWLENHLRQATVPSSAELPELLSQWADALGLDNQWLLAKPALLNAIKAGVSAPEAIATTLAQGLNNVKLPESGVVFVVGPAGAGKTTLINKMVMSDIRRSGHGGLTLLTTDGNRLGAQEQLRAAGRVLDVPVQSAFTPDDLRATLQRLSQERLVIVDTAGLQVRNDASLKALIMQLACAPSAEIILAVPTDADPRSLRALMSRCSGLPISSVALTRIDMSYAIAPTLSLINDYGLPISALNRSPRMTDGIEAAHKDIEVLIAQTMVQADELLNQPVKTEAAQALTA